MTKFGPKLLLIAVLALGAALRLYQLTAISFWRNEAITGLLVRVSWHEMFHRVYTGAKLPLYFILVKLYSYAFGSGVFSLRAFSVLFGVLTIYIGFIFIKQAFHGSDSIPAGRQEKLGLVGALLLAINPYLIQTSQEAQSYATATFLALISSYLLLRALAKPRWSNWIYYTISIVASLYTYYPLFIIIAIQGLYLIYHLYQEYHQNWRLKLDNPILLGLLSIIASIALFLPWGTILITRLKDLSQQPLNLPFNRWTISETFWKITFGGQGTNHIAVIIISALFFILTFYFFRELKSRLRWFILISIIVLFGGSLLISENFLPLASVFLVLMLSITIYLASKYTYRRNLAIAFALVSMLIMYKNVHDLNASAKPGMVAAALLVKDSSGSQDKIYAGSTFTFLSFKYYNQTRIKPLLYSPTTPQNLTIDSAEATSDFSHAQKKDTAWLVWTTGFNQIKPNVPGNWDKIQEIEYPDAPSYKGSIIVTEYHVN